VWALDGPARVLRVLLLVTAVLSAVLAVLAVRLLDELDRVDPTAVVGSQDAQDALDSFLGAMSAFGVVVVGIGVLFVVWMWRAARNNQAFGRPGALGPGWALGSWFIPIGSLFLPAVQLQQLWKGADAGLGRDDPGWKRVKGSGRLWVWWVSFVLGQLLAFVGFSVVTSGTDGDGQVTVAGLADRLDEVETALAAFVAGQVVLIVAAALGALTVVAVSRRQAIAVSALGLGTGDGGDWVRRRAPAAWLDDPTGRADLRWWDGEVWTEHVSRGGVQGTDPL